MSGSSRSAALTDEELAAEARAGSHGSFAVLVERYDDLLVRYVARRVGDWLLAEDLVQDTLVAAWVGLASYDPGRPFRPWLFGIAENMIRMDARRRGRTAEVSLDKLSLEERGADDLAGRGRLDVSNEVALKDAIQRALSGLAEEDRAVLLLARLVGLPMREVGETLGVSEATARQRVHRAEARFRKRYTTPYDDDTFPSDDYAAPNPSLR